MPFPRRLNSNFFPKRRTSSFSNTMTEEVKAAIKDKWTFDKSLGEIAGSSSGEDELLPPCATKVNQRSIRPDTVPAVTAELAEEPATINVPATPPPRKQRFEPLRPRSRLMTDPSHKDTKENAQTQLPEEDTRSLVASFELTRKAFSPGAWGHSPGLPDVVSNTKAKHALPTRPATPRPLEISNQSLSRVVPVADSEEPQATSDTAAEDCGADEVPLFAAREASTTGGLRLRSPSSEIGNRGDMISSNIKKRGRSSIFDLEKEPLFEASARRKKQRTGQEDVMHEGQQPSISATITNALLRDDQFKASGDLAIPCRQVLKDHLYLPRI